MSIPDLTFSRRLRYGAEAGLFFFVMGLFRLLPLDTASGLGAWIGRSLFSRLPPDRIARANLTAAFPEKSPAEIEIILAGMWDNLGRTVAEYAHLDKFTLDGPDPRLTLIGTEHIDAGLAAGKGVMFVAAHMANWEMMPITAEQYGIPGATVVRHPNNPIVARWLERQRGLKGSKDQIGKHGGTRRILARLKAGHAIYMMVDQNNDEGIAVPFFGRGAMTTPVPAALCLKLGSRVLYAHNKRLGRTSRFEITVTPAPEFIPSGDDAADTRLLTERFTAEVERMIRAEPSQWLWIHRRWR